MIARILKIWPPPLQKNRHNFNYFARYVCPFIIFFSSFLLKCYCNCNALQSKQNSWKSITNFMEHWASVTPFELNSLSTQYSIKTLCVRWFCIHVCGMWIFLLHFSRIVSSCQNPFSFRFVRRVLDLTINYR